MAFPFLLSFVGLLCAYMLTARWAGADARYLIAFGLVILIGAATAAASLDSSFALTLAEFAPFLLLGGLVLMILETRRPSDLQKKSAEES